jgi:hypothetical protein
MDNLKLYCNCFLNKEPKFYQFDQTPVMCGSYGYSPDYKLEVEKKGFILDDTLNQISHLNEWFGELTGLYWVWKNTSDPFVGTNQYRHFWDANELALSKNVIYVPNSLDVSNAVRDSSIKSLSIYDQYAYCHGGIHWSLLHGLIKTSDIPLKAEMIDQLKNESMLIPYNMFIAERSVFNKLCEILFEILFRFYEVYHLILPAIRDQRGQARNLDFLAERVLHMIYSNINYYFDNVKITTLNVKSYLHD